MTETYICPNCREKRELDHNDPTVGPECPGCNVEWMTEMRQPECGNCDSTTFTLYDPKKARVDSPDPILECVECGWTGRVDEDGVWY